MLQDSETARKIPIMLRNTYSNVLKHRRNF